MYEHTITVDAVAKERIDAMIQVTGLTCSDLIRKLIEINGPETPVVAGVRTMPKYKKENALHIGEGLLDAVYLSDRDGNIVTANKVFMEMTGITEGQMINNPGVASLLRENFLSNGLSAKVFRDKETVSIVSLVRGRKMIVSVSPIQDNTGEVARTLTVMRDVTGLVKLQEQLEYSQKLTKHYIDEVNYLRHKETNRSTLLGNSPSMRRIRDIISQVAQADATVLITGETGVGKEIVANELHKNSLRRRSPYIKVNCAAIPETLLESEMFGYEKGAFTGAGNRDKLGLFEMADSGTILLDEIGDMSIELQSKLLRVVQEKELIRVGSTKSVKLDVRILASTNQQLEERVANGEFRQDLYYRLNVVPIRVPPLRERREDIPILANHFIEQFNEKHKTKKHLDILAVDVMRQYDWPGNVRELENVIEQLVVISREPEISADHIIGIINNGRLLPASADQNHLTLKEAVDAVERQIIQKALATYGSTHKAARVLGVSQPTVLRKAKKLGLRTD